MASKHVSMALGMYKSSTNNKVNVRETDKVSFVELVIYLLKVKCLK